MRSFPKHSRMAVGTALDRTAALSVLFFDGRDGPKCHLQMVTKDPDVAGTGTGVSCTSHRILLGPVDHLMMLVVPAPMLVASGIGGNVDDNHFTRTSKLAVGGAVTRMPPGGRFTTTGGSPPPTGWNAHSLSAAPDVGAAGVTDMGRPPRSMVSIVVRVAALAFFRAQGLSPGDPN